MHRQGMYTSVSWKYLDAWRRIIDSLIYHLLSKILAFIEFRGSIPCKWICCIPDESQPFLYPPWFCHQSYVFKYCKYVPYILLVLCWRQAYWACSQNVAVSYNCSYSDTHTRNPLTWCFSDRASWIDYILINNLMHWLLFIHKILFSSTCFKPQVLIFRRVQLYTCSIWYCHSLWEFLVACRYTAWVRTDCRGKVVGRAS